MKRLLCLFFVCTLHSVCAQIINIEDRRTSLKDSIGFGGSADIGFSMLQNTRQILTGKVGVQLEFANKKHFLLAIGGYNALQADGQKLSNDGFAHLRYNYDLRTVWVGELFGQMQYNELLRIRRRTLGGAGVRLKLRPLLGQRVYLGASYLYEVNELSNGLTLRYHRMNNYLSFHLKLPRESKFVSTTYYQPVITHFANARLATENTLQFKITQKLSFRTTFSLVFDGDPMLPTEVPNTTYQITNALRWDF